MNSQPKQFHTTGNIFQEICLRILFTATIFFVLKCPNKNVEEKRIKVKYKNSKFFFFMN